MYAVSRYLAKCRTVSRPIHPAIITGCVTPHQIKLMFRNFQEVSAKSLIICIGTPVFIYLFVYLVQHFLQRHFSFISSNHLSGQIFANEKLNAQIPEFSFDGKISKHVTFNGYDVDVFRNKPLPLVSAKRVGGITSQSPV